jgi:hypothetical protein
LQAITEPVTPTKLILFLLGSTVLSAVVSSAVTLITSALQYRRDYYREVIRRRLEAYESVHRVLSELRFLQYRKGAEAHHQAEVFHTAFASGEDGVAALDALLQQAMGESLWLDDRTRNRLVSLNRLLLRVPKSGTPEEIISAGIAIRDELTAERERLELTTAQSLGRLHKIRSFLRRKARAAKKNRPRIVELPRPK